MRCASGQSSTFLGLALLALTRGSAATGEGPIPARVEYAAHALCPDESDFTRQLLERTRRIEIVPSERAQWQFSVYLFRQGTGSRGILRVVDASGQASERSVAAATCAEVVSALALVAALTVDPEAAEPAPPAKQTPTPARASASRPRAPARSVQPSKAAPPQQLASPKAAPARVVATAGVELQLQGAVAPEPMPVERVFAEAELESTNLVLPALRLSVGRGRNAFDHVLATPVWMTWTSARLELLVPWSPVAGLALRPGAFFDAGALTGATSESRLIVASEPQTRTWAAAGIAGRASWRPLGPLVLELAAGAFLPLYWNDEFTFDDPEGGPSVRVHSIPDMSGFIGAGIGVTSH